MKQQKNNSQKKLRTSMNIKSLIKKSGNEFLGKSSFAVTIIDVLRC